MIVRLEEWVGTIRDECPPQKAWRKVEHRPQYATARHGAPLSILGARLIAEGKVLRRGE